MTMKDVKSEDLIFFHYFIVYYVIVIYSYNNLNIDLFL